MCSIFGCISKGGEHADSVGFLVEEMIQASIHRGRDGLGVYFTHVEDSANRARLITTHQAGSTGSKNVIERASEIAQKAELFSMIGNARAEPTTEWVVEKSNNDQQPYKLGAWTIVHNGTIANDKNLRTGAYPTEIDSAAIVELLCEFEKSREPKSVNGYYDLFVSAIRCLKGSFAILAVHESAPGFIFSACNYRPIWFGRNNVGMWLASEREMLPHNCIPEMQEPYSCQLISHNTAHNERHSLYDDSFHQARALVVASGGLDSTVAAQVCKNQGMDVTLINFQYGCRAESNELKAIQNIANVMDVPLVLFPIPIYDPKDSPLFNVEAEIAGGEAGAEFAHEWVPARNLVMLSVATAYAEANGFDFIVLGNNLEEAGAYPDNEPEFINRFNALLPFAVGDGKRVRVLMPVGNLMKHEIVALGLQQGAPLSETWSCYRNGDLHCGNCGPCMMRKTAFAISSEPEVIKYQNEV